MYVLTAPPKTGKSTAIKKIINMLGAKNCCGFYTKEIIEDGKRVGFKIVTLSGKEGILAHVSYDGEYRIGKYGVNLEEFEKVKEIKMKVDQRRRDFFNLIREKLFLLDDIYVIYSTITNEPHLFATASLDGNKGITVSHSWVYLIPSSYMHYRKDFYKKNERVDFKRIENGPEKEGIRNFLRDLFIYDGVESILYFTEDTLIFAKELMDLPNYEGVDEAEIPVTNPDLMKFLHLSSQLDGIEDKEEKNIGKAYFYLLARFTKTAKFIAPMQLHGYDQLLEDNPQTAIEPNIPFNLAIKQGKTKEKAVQVYTDWKRLRKHFGEEYKGLVVTLDELVKEYDVVINPGEYPIALFMTEKFFNAVD